MRYYNFKRRNCLGGGVVKIVIEAESKEMADFILELQNQPNKTIELITNSLDDVKISRI